MTIASLVDFILPDPLGPLGKLVERVRGTSVLPVLEQLRQSDRMTRGALSALRDEKLQALLHHTADNCAWYAKCWGSAGISPDQVHIADDLVRLPVFTRQDLREGLEHGLVARNIDRMQVEHAASGGTTGDPVRLLIDRRSRSVGGAAMLRYYEWWERRLGERMAILWGRQDPHNISTLNRWRRDAKRFLTRRRYLNTFYLDDRVLAAHYAHLRRFDPVILRGYANSLYLMAIYIRDNGLAVWPSLRMISSTSEQLTPTMRRYIEEVLGVAVANQYGSGEVYGVAFECPEGRSMHVAEEHVIVEVVDEQGAPVWDQPGRILLTDLDNYALPLIRYEVGDLGILSKTPCSCGRSHVVLQEIVGRLSEALELANGRRIAPSYWSVLLRSYPEIQNACVRVLSPAHLQIDVVLSEALSVDVRNHLLAAARQAVGEGVRVEFRHVDHIPAVKSGKRPWVRRAEDEVGSAVPYQA